jgi:GNAT superfamily N-acetyltransferase
MAKRPSADLRILPLGEMHDRAGFTCGVETLDRYLKTQAGQDVRRKANAVLLLGLETESERVLGYYTLCAMAVSQGEVPEAARKHVPRYPLVSCTLMVRLAVARDQQGQRLGSILLADALERAFESARTVGSSVVIVDALDEAAAGFYAAHGFVRLPDSPRLVMPTGQAGRGSEHDAFAIPAHAGEAPGEPNPKGYQAPGKQAHLRRGHVIQRVHAFAGSGRLRQLWGPTHAESGRAPATTCSLLLPSCFPGFPDGGGEAKGGPERPF